MTTQRGRWAYVVSPHAGGTFSVFDSLACGLAEQGVTLHWVSCFSPDSESQRIRYRREAPRGFALHKPGIADAQLATYIGEELTARSIEGVFINVRTSSFEMNLARYLPAHVLRVQIVHNMTQGTYKPAKALRDYVHATVCVSPRIQQDLVRSYGFNPLRTFCIPNAVDLTPYQGLPRTSRADTIRLLSVGRIEETSKGILWLPEILSHLEGVNWILTVAGDGPDLTKLRERCQRFGDRVRFLGTVPRSEVPTLAAGHDVFIMPSRFEGFGYTLIETMAAGCVPVASHIRGVTDWIVTDKKDGLLFPVGHCQRAAECILSLAKNAGALADMAKNAAQAVPGRFDTLKIAEQYREVMEAAKSFPVHAPLSNWSDPKEFSPGLRRFVPDSIKNLLRKWRA